MARFLFLTLTLFYSSTLLLSTIHAADPGFAGFTPLEYWPCTRTTNSEFHPLRPYPASPCDEFIPLKTPEAPLTTPRIYQTFSCNNSLNLTGTYTVLDFVPTEISVFPGNCTANLEATNGTTQAYLNYYDCGGGVVCLVHKITLNFNVDLTASRLPIIGNTEFPASDTVQVNSYLDWYLNGTILHSERRPLNPENPYDQRRITTYSGPLLKQLSLDLQTEIRDTLRDNPPVEDEIHDYKVSDSILSNRRMSQANEEQYKYIVLSTQEDTTSEITVGLYRNNQPPSDGQIVLNCPANRPFEIALGSRNSTQGDFRVYFPHMRSDATLSDTLASLSLPIPPTPTPSPPPVSTSDTDLFTQKIDEHQGIDDSTLVLRSDYRTGTTSRNTEIGGNSVVYPGRDRAPDPLITPAPADLNCEQTIALTNYGDLLMGNTTNSDLTYYQRFEYNPAYRGTIQGCSLEGQPCTLDSQCCAFNAGYTAGGCTGNEEYVCDYINSSVTVLPCPTYDEATCTAFPGRLYCQMVLEQTVGSCNPWPRRELDSAAQISVFTKTPLIEKIYDTLVVGPQSIMRRFLPLKPTGWPEAEYLKGETNLENAIPGATTTNYTGTAVGLNTPLVSGGNGLFPIDIYFDRLGSLSDHFLGDITEEKANLQKMLRPFVSPTPTPNP